MNPPQVRGRLAASRPCNHLCRHALIVEMTLIVEMPLIIEMRAGSHLYGTSTPNSDLDLKSVHLPEGRDILLQRVRDVIVSTRSKAAGERNLPGDVDRESFSLQRYLALLADGQTIALEMLFAPDQAFTAPPSPLWREIQANAHRLTSRRAASFLGYCRQQASRYGIRGERVTAARAAHALLSEAEARLGGVARLERIAAGLEPLAAQPHIALIDVPAPGGGVIRHLEVCGRKTPFTASIKTARETAQRLLDAYGRRSLEAERQGGADWKALSHAVRVGREAIELLTTGRITLPLPCAAHVLRIKQGEIAQEAVAEEIDALLLEVEAAATASTLPDAPDLAWIDELVAAVYRERCAAGPDRRRGM